MNQINTRLGPVVLLEPTDAALRRIGNLLPFGMTRLVGEMRSKGAEYGLVMQQDDQEAAAVKLQPVDCGEATAWEGFAVNRVLLARSMGAYQRTGHSGLMFPCAYLRDKQGARFESGLAYFGRGAAANTNQDGLATATAFDEFFGPGYSAMLHSMMAAVSASAAVTGLGLYRAIGLDVRPRMQLGTIDFGFLVVDQTVVCLKTRIAEDDPTWEALRAGGVEEVVRVPAIPVSV